MKPSTDNILVSPDASHRSDNATAFETQSDDKTCDKSEEDAVEVMDDEALTLMLKESKQSPVKPLPRRSTNSKGLSSFTGLSNVPSSTTNYG